MNEENLPQSFKMAYTLHRPWSDILFETTLPPMILEKMIKISDKVLGDSKRTPWGNNLAGQIKEELNVRPHTYTETNMGTDAGHLRKGTQGSVLLRRTV